MGRFVSRAGEKLDHALTTFEVDVKGWVCADFGANAGGFTDSLLSRGAAKVYAIDTGYGALEWKLRTDPRVVVMERTNAMHVELPEKVDLVTIDVAWTKQRLILPSAQRVLKPTGQIITLIKPHYESPPTHLKSGVLPEPEVDAVVTRVLTEIKSTALEVLSTTRSPLLGTKGNIEVLALLKASNDQ